MSNEATLTQDKLRVVDAAMLQLYDNKWRNRWTWDKFVAVWSPLVTAVSPEILARVVEEMVRTRTEELPPLPGQFAELIRAGMRRYDYGPSHEPQYAPRSPANEKLVQEMFASLAIAVKPVVKRPEPEIDPAMVDSHVYTDAPELRALTEGWVRS